MEKMPLYYFVTIDTFVKKSVEFKMLGHTEPMSQYNTMLRYNGGKTVSDCLTYSKLQSINSLDIPVD